MASSSSSFGRSASYLASYRSDVDLVIPDVKNRLKDKIFNLLYQHYNTDMTFDLIKFKLDNVIYGMSGLLFSFSEVSGDKWMQIHVKFNGLPQTGSVLRNLRKEIEKRNTVDIFKSI